MTTEDKPMAIRVTQHEARRHFEAGGAVLVSEYGLPDPVQVGPSTVTHSRESTTWEQLVYAVDMWRHRYPRQRYYNVIKP